jgi:hypothetical protein
MPLSWRQPARRPHRTHQTDCGALASPARSHGSSDTDRLGAIHPDCTIIRIRALAGLTTAWKIIRSGFPAVSPGCAAWPCFANMRYGWQSPPDRRGQPAELKTDRAGPVAAIVLSPTYGLGIALAALAERPGDVTATLLAATAWLLTHRESPATIRGLPATIDKQGGDGKWGLETRFARLAGTASHCHFWRPS